MTTLYIAATVLLFWAFPAALHYGIKKMDAEHALDSFDGPNWR